MPPKRRPTGGVGAAKRGSAAGGSGGAGASDGLAGKRTTSGVGGAASAGNAAANAKAPRINSNATLVTGLKGERYEGELNDKGKREGHGVLTWPNGNRYVGEWKDGKMSGAGLFTYGVEGDRYEGQFLDDKKHGKGCYTFANGNKYEGDFSLDKRHGFGKYHWVCGDLYSGEWKEGRMEGRGVTIYSNGNKYEGEFKEDRREGKGKLTCTDGLIFDGEWKSNMRHGHGVLIFPTGDRYEGGWREDRKHGKGTDIFVNGNVFTGMYENNVKCGKGSMTYANGDEYEGDWVDDKMHGQGVYRFGNGFVYNGSWARDCRDGHGVYTFPNQNQYTGQWSNDKRHGKGAFHVQKTNETYTGTWAAGKMDGTFVVTGEDKKERYRGAWSGGVVAGKGTMFVNGYQFHGQWDPATQPKKTDGTIEIPHTLPPPPGPDAEADPAELQLECDRKVRASADEVKSIQLQLSDAMSSAALFKVQSTWKQEEEEENARMRETNIALQNELATLKSLADDAKAFDKKLKEMTKEFDAAQDALKTAKDKVAKLEKDLSRESSAAAKAKKEAKSLETKEKEASEQLKDALKKLNAAETDLKNVRTQVKSEKNAQARDDKRYDKLNEEAADRQSRIEELEKLMDRMKMASENAEKERDRIKRAHEKLKTEHASCEGNAKTLSEDLAKAKTLLEKSTDRCKALESDVASLRDKQKDLKKNQSDQTNQKLVEAQKTADAERARIHAEKEELAKKLTAALAQVEKASEKAEKAALEAKASAGDLKKAKDLDAQIAKLQEDLDTANAARDKAERANEKDQKSKDRDSKDKHKLEQKLQRAVEEAEAEKKAHETTKRQAREVQALADSLNAQFNDEMRKGAEQESKNLTLKTHLSEANRKARELEQELTRLNKQLAAEARGNGVDSSARNVEILSQQLNDMQSASGAYQEQINTLRTRLADLSADVEKKDDSIAALKEAEAMREKEFRTNLKALEREKDDVLKQLQKHLDNPKSPGGGGGGGKSDAAQAEIARLKGLCKEYLDDLKFERAEVKTLQQDLEKEKKRRKRAEKNAGDNLSTESLRMQMIHMRADLEKKTKELEELRSSQLKQNHDLARIKEQAPLSPGSDGRWNLMLMGGVDAGHSDAIGKIKALAEQIEEKDRIIEDMKLEVNRVRLLESKLQAANARIQGLSASTSMDRNKGDFLSYTEQERFRAREMINKERTMINEHERKEMSAINDTLAMGRPTLRNATPTQLNAISGRRAGSFPSANGGIGGGGGMPIPVPGGQNADGEAGGEGMYARADSGSWRPKPPRMTRPQMHAMHTGGLP